MRVTVADGDELVVPGGVLNVRLELPGGRNAEVLSEPLRDGEPSIFMGGWDDGIFVDLMTLRPGDAQQVPAATAKC